MKVQLLFILIFSGLGLKAQDSLRKPPLSTIKTEDKTIAVYDFSGLEPLLHLKNDSTYIINFWATWCIPCVQELPYFEQMLKKYSKDGLSVKLISLDFPKQVDKSLIPFLMKKKLKSEVILLDDKDPNDWINKVNPNWSGALPATIIYNKTKRLFFEKNFNFEELEQEYLKLKNK